MHPSKDECVLFKRNENYGTKNLFQSTNQRKFFVLFEARNDK